MNNGMQNVRALSDEELITMLREAAKQLGADDHALDGVMKDMDAVRKKLSLQPAHTEDER